MPIILLDLQRCKPMTPHATDTPSLSSYSSLLFLIFTLFLILTLFVLILTLLFLILTLFFLGRWPGSSVTWASAFLRRCSRGPGSWREPCGPTARCVCMASGRSSGKLKQCDSHRDKHLLLYLSYGSLLKVTASLRNLATMSQLHNDSLK